MNNDLTVKAPLTPKMMEALTYCYKKEALYLDPYEASTFSYLHVLIIRGMLCAKTYVTAHGKKIIAFYLTNSARDYLSETLL